MDFKFDLTQVKWVKGYYDLPEAYIKLKIPSVTTILNEMVPDPDLEKWKSDVGEEQAKKISESAGNRGTSMHTFIENFINILTKTKDPSEALKYTQIESQKILESLSIPQDRIDIGRDLFYNFYQSDFVNLYNQVINTELTLFSKKYFFRGKLDVIYKELLYGICVTDFKTSSSNIKKGSIKEKKYKLQCGAYCIAIEDMFEEKNIKINKSSILCMNTKTNGVQNIEIIGDELNSYKEEFKTLLREYHIKNNQEFLVN